MSRQSHFPRLSALSFVGMISSSLALPQSYSTAPPPGNTNTTLNVTIPSIKFSACSEELPSNLECGTLSVPIDWEVPTGEHFDLGVVRLPAPANSTTKIGSLFVNPGGPGGSASLTVAALASGEFPAEDLFNAFDVIGVDPRGVGLSNAIKCNMSIYAERVSLFPTSEDEYERLVDKNKRFGESCRELTGPLFEHLDTISAAKDHEAVRIALGDKPINYLGFSYGTQLGAQYAQLFPDNIRTLVLDGVLQHSESASSNLLVESSAYSLSLSRFFEWASAEEESPLKDQDVQSLWYDLLANATESPLPAPDCNGTLCASDVTAEEILFNVQGGLTRFSSWDLLASALFNATQGDASGLATRFDVASSAPFLGIGCLDWPSAKSPTLAEVHAMKHLADTFTPLTQGASQSWTLLHACIGWPVSVKNPPKKLDIDTETTILMVNSDADPSTGYPWAVGMQEQIRNKAFITRKGDGHTSTLEGGNTTQVVFEYLISGVAPEDGLFLDS